MESFTKRRQRVKTADLGTTGQLDFSNLEWMDTIKLKPTEDNH